MKEVNILETKENELTVCLSGDIDAGNADAFLAEVTAAYGEGKDLVFDCKELAFIDSTTLGTFVKIFKRTQADGKKMKLVALPQKIKKLLVICALDTMMEIE
ncbi:MAG: STAS domain-containing protein [Clostridia bacterium]|nr:STAS domain-containing protein [Clostridia bacterium]